jgi:hypothetical protein
MSKTVLFSLIFVFVFLLAAVSYSSWKEFFPFLYSEKQIAAFDFSQEDFRGISSFSIKKEENEFIFERQNEVWEINGLTASTTHIQSFLESISTILSKELVSQNPNNHENFGVSEKSGIFVKIGDENTFWVGNKGRELYSFYIRKDQEEKVYLAKGNIKTFIEKDLSFWQEKKIIQISPENIQSIHIFDNERNHVISKEEDGLWSFQRIEGTDAEEITEEDMEHFFAVINPLEAKKIGEKQLEEKFTKMAENVIRIRIEEQEKNTEISFLEEDTEWWGKTPEKDEIYLLYPSDVETILFRNLKQKVEKEVQEEE